MIDVKALGRRARAAASPLANASIKLRDAALKDMSACIRNAVPQLLAANQLDLDGARKADMDAAFVDRLRLTEARIESMAAAIDEVRALPSPLGQMEDVRDRPNGLKVGRMRIPIGVIAIIYEARPNVTSDAASLCLKAGNPVILKGGRFAQKSNEAILVQLRNGLEAVGLPPDAVQLFSSGSRDELAELLTLEDHIDLVIPRGGEGLIRFVSEHSRIPVLKHYKGVCHVFLDASADENMAVEIVLNSKAQRPGVCNALETLLVHESAAERLLPAVARALLDAGVTLHGCDQTQLLLAKQDIHCLAASEDDYHAEYLSLDLAIKVVRDLDHAAEHIRTYGSDHTEAIVTDSHGNAMRFLATVNSSCVLVNASTRFADGGQLGLGAEIGISTSKLHSFGPMGLEDLTARKYVVFGDGQIRSS